MTGMGKSIIEQQKVSPINLEISEDQIEKMSITPREEGFDSHPATGAYSLLYIQQGT